MSDERASLTNREWTRRELLKFVGVGAAAATTWSLLDPTGRTALLDRAKLIADPNAPSLTVRMRRREDMLDLTVDLYNLTVVGGASDPRLVRIDAAKDAFIVARFQPQSIFEQSFLEADGAGGDRPPQLLAGSRLAGESQLAFKVPAATASVPYTVAGLLGWAALESNLAPNATQAGLTPQAPSVLQTAIEAPYRLVLSPDGTATWAHATAPVQHTTRTELWHTRLAARGTTGQPDERLPRPKVRGIYAPPPSNDSDPFGASAAAPQSLHANEREAIVKLSATGTFNYIPKPVDVNALMLSPLGAWLDLDGNWDAPLDVSTIENWRHRSTMGRDHYVRVIKRGFLFPFGHRAVLIRITERKFQTPATGTAKGAYLRTREFLVVREPVKNYGDGVCFAQPKDGRKSPFRRAEITTLVTPNITKQVILGNVNIFWPLVNGAVFEFTMRLDDWEAQRSSITLPLAFVDGDPATHRAAMQALIDEYNGPNGFGFRLADLAGQKLALAPPTAGKSGDTTFPAGMMTFGAEGPIDGVGDSQFASALQPCFYPTVEEVELDVPAAAALAGPGQLSLVKVSPDATYVDKGIDHITNKARVFAKLVDAPSLGFPSTDKAGGVASPNMLLSHLSRDFGPVGGGDLIKSAGQFNPETALGAAKLLGDLKLSDVLAVVNFSPPSPGALPDPRVPGLKTEVIYPNNDKTKPPDLIRNTFTLRPDLKEDPAHIFDPRGSSLELRVVNTIRPGNPAGSTTDIFGDLKHFAIRFVGTDPATQFIVLTFDRMAFTSLNGGKPDIDVKIANVRFAGPLEFVNKLEELLKSSGSGPYVDVSPKGIKAGFTLSVPTVGFGVFSLQNLALAAGITLPFDGSPMRADFAVATREHPFIVTVSIFGGGGFFGVSVGTKTLERLEASLEFGGNIAFDIGVASGGVHVMAGIYFKLEALHKGVPSDPDHRVTLTGFVRVGGELEILGIVTISVEFYLGLAYEGPPAKVSGDATLTVSVEIGPFSKSVQLSVHKEFAGGGDPTFGDTITRPQWGTYCDAFA